MFAIRLVKTAMVASTALFALLVAYNNLADYNSNYEFVRRTLSMLGAEELSALRLVGVRGDG